MIVNPDFFHQRKKRQLEMAKRFTDNLKEDLKRQIEKKQLDYFQEQVKNGRKFRMSELREIGNSVQTPLIKNEILKFTIDSIKVQNFDSGKKWNHHLLRNLFFRLLNVQFFTLFSYS